MTLALCSLELVQPFSANYSDAEPCGRLPLGSVSHEWYFESSIDKVPFAAAAVAAGQISPNY